VLCHTRPYLCYAVVDSETVVPWNAGAGLGVSELQNTSINLRFRSKMQKIGANIFGRIL
jgi:hypothetical protein